MLKSPKNKFQKLKKNYFKIKICNKIVDLYCLIFQLLIINVLLFKQ